MLCRLKACSLAQGKACFSRRHPGLGNRLYIYNEHSLRQKRNIKLISYLKSSEEHAKELTEETLDVETLKMDLLKTASMLALYSWRSPPVDEVNKFQQLNTYQRMGSDLGALPQRPHKTFIISTTLFINQNNTESRDNHS